VQSEARQLNGRWLATQSSIVCASQCRNFKRGRELWCAHSHLKCNFQFT